MLKNAVKATREAVADVDEIVIRDLKLLCLEIYACKETGTCVMKDGIFRDAEK